MPPKKQNVKRNTCLTLQERKEIVDKLDKGAWKSQIAKEYNICPRTVAKIIKAKDEIEKLAGKEINLTRKRVAYSQHRKYKQLKDSLHKWYREKIKSRHFSKELFMTKGIEFIREFGGPSTKEAEKQLLKRYLQHFENQESTNCKAQNSPENTQSLAQDTDRTKHELD